MNRQLLVCMQYRSGPGTSCAVRHGGDLLEALATLIQDAGLDVEVKPINCFVKCELGANVKLMPDGKFWHHVSGQMLPEIVDFLRASSD
jgi:(2Fe-2S) ferredoxin